MKLPMKTMTDRIIALGADKVQHTGKTYLAHAIGVYKLMKSWGEDDEICRAAMFHSIYGTEGFQDFTLPLEQRDAMREFIGDRAEWLAYVNSAMKRDTFYCQVALTREKYPITDRLTGDTMQLTVQEFQDLIRLHLCDMLEQVERDNVWDSQREIFRQMAVRTGGAALECYDTVFAREPVQV